MKEYIKHDEMFAALNEIYKEVFRTEYPNLEAYYAARETIENALNALYEIAKEEEKMDFMQIKLDDGAFMPERAHRSDAGLDIRSPISVTVPGSREYFGEVMIGNAVIKTGVHVAIPEGHVGLLKSKSGLNVNHGITSEGVIDAGYTGEIVVKLYNYSQDDYVVKAGDKISQLIILPIISPSLELCDKLPETSRGDNGFGSSGR